MGLIGGLCIAQADAHFKVLGQERCGDKHGIFLLHLPDDENWQIWKKMSLPLDESVYQMAVQRFRIKCNAEIIPELSTQAWLDRCSMPLGMDENGRLFDL